MKEFGSNFAGNAESASLLQRYKSRRETMDTEHGHTDAELMAILDQKSTWTVNGRQGRIHFLATTLRAAIVRAAAFDAARPVVLELCRQPSDNLIVSAPQLHRLMKLVSAPAEEEITAGDEVTG
jgi:hypothetical protein